MIPLIAPLSGDALSSSSVITSSASTSRDTRSITSKAPTLALVICRTAVLTSVSPPHQCVLPQNVCFACFASRMSLITVCEKTQKSSATYSARTPSGSSFVTTLATLGVPKIARARSAAAAATSWHMHLIIVRSMFFLASAPLISKWYIFFFLASGTSAPFAPGAVEDVDFLREVGVADTGAGEGTVAATGGVGSHAPAAVCAPAACVPNPNAVGS
mmetsp:Transcript_2754/g.10538  ORF Transcript_2754/g.10538 Transcript_2754/m.10538 type:complete len:216 (-) Transcript_2754:427-1074(-)